MNFYIVPLKEKIVDGNPVMRPHSEVPFFEVHSFRDRGLAVIAALEKPKTAVDVPDIDALEVGASHIAWWLIYDHEVPVPEVNP